MVDGPWTVGHRLAKLIILNLVQFCGVMSCRFFTAVNHPDLELYPNRFSLAFYFAAAIPFL